MVEVRPLVKAERDDILRRGRENPGQIPPWQRLPAMPTPSAKKLVVALVHPDVVNSCHCLLARRGWVATLGVVGPPFVFLPRRGTHGAEILLSRSIISGVRQRGKQSSAGRHYTKRPTTAPGAVPGPNSRSATCEARISGRCARNEVITPAA